MLNNIIFECRQKRTALFKNSYSNSYLEFCKLYKLDLDQNKVAALLV